MPLWLNHIFQVKQCGLYNTNSLLKTFITKRLFYLQIVDNHKDEIDNDIMFLVNLYLYKEVKNMYNQLETGAKALKKLQHNKDSNIADACKIYLELLQNKELKAMIPVNSLVHLVNP